jgi:RHS repeat-associated protein
VRHIAGTADAQSLGNAVARHWGFAYNHKPFADKADQVILVTTPGPADGEAPQITFTEYDAMGRSVKITQPDGALVSKEYYLSGQLKRTYGARTYPVEYTYDTQGRMKTMTTWQDYAKREGAAVTTWNYDLKRGFLQSKRYADGQGPEYEYYASGKIKNRKWARGISTTYRYTPAGELETIAYSDKQTPSVRHEYDRQGRRFKAVQGELVTTQTFNSAGQMLSESYQGGVLDGLGVFNRYDALNRRIELSARNSSVLTRQAFSYDAASRLDTVAEGEYSAQYHYVANSPLVEEIVFKQGETVRMKTRKEHDRLNRLKSIQSEPSNDQVIRYGYEYNQANQRTQIQMPDQTAWEYGYDALGQVIRANNTGAKQNATGVARFEYAYDDIGNRKRAATEGEEQQYQSDALNRYQAVLSGQTADTLEYDADGNLVGDDQWIYTWDAENRLLGMESAPGIPSGQRKRLDFTYDSQSHRISKKLFPWQSSTFSLQPSAFSLFVYDGWNLIAELSQDAEVKTPVQTYVWGLDLSGSLQGAGGVGGLLWVVDWRTSDLFAMAYDGNGNIKGLLDSGLGNWVGQYEYSPFGEMIKTTGSKYQSNPLRFSTKYTDEETELLYYGLRYYQPASGKWLSRDPIGESQMPGRRSENLHSFCGNDVVNYWDYLGLWYPSDHTSLTTSSFNSAWNEMGDPGTCVGSRLRAILINRNVGTDNGSDGTDLKQHYNRAVGDFPDTARQAYVSNIQSLTSSYSSLLSGNTNKQNCVTALNKLGQVSHSWQDYYAHAIGLNSPLWGNPGPIAGNPDSPSTNLKPASWGGGTAEHGPNEPGSREPDGGYNRLNQATSFVTGKYENMLPSWMLKCRCFCSANWP